MQPKTGKMNTAVIAGAAAAGVLVIAGVIIFAIWWKRRKSSPDGKLNQIRTITLCRLTLISGLACLQ